MGASLSAVDYFGGRVLSEAVYDRTYSRTKPNGDKESWPETIARVVDGNLGLVDQCFIEPDEREQLIALFMDMQALPAGRHLWASGVPGRQFLMNCHRAGWSEKLSDHFAFTFDALMCGGGVGANYSSTYLEQLPVIKRPVFLDFICDEGHPDFAEIEPMVANTMGDSKDVHVEDSREGWVRALRILIDLHTVEGEAQPLALDMSKVRGRGQPIRGFGGIASGPGPLMLAFKNVNRLLNERVGQKLDPITAMKIDHALSECVTAGNVRRSARMSMLHWKDPHIFEFINSKSEHLDMWTTNISVEVDNDFLWDLHMSNSHASKVMDAVVAGMLANGEPGLYNSSLASVGEHDDVRCTNPCGEQSLNEWDACNLGHVNLAAYAGDHDGAVEAFRLMARFLVRATFGDIEDKVQQDVVRRNRRIGVGFFGFQEWLAAQSYSYSEAHMYVMPKLMLEQYYRTVRAAADEYAFQLHINRPVKVTTVAPTGTIAKLAGVSEGIEPIYAKHFVRRVRYANNDPALKEFIETHEVEPCVYSANTSVVSFVCKDTMLDRVPAEHVEAANEISVHDQLAVQAMVQDKYADNAISKTINVPPGMDKAELRRALVQYLPRLKGVTVFPDMSRPQSPYERITETEYEAAMFKEVSQAMDDCKSGACPIK